MFIIKKKNLNLDLKKKKNEIIKNFFFLVCSQLFVFQKNKYSLMKLTLQ